MKVLHIITDLDVGGAENMLVSLVTELQKRGIDNQVIGLGNEGSIGEHIRSNGIEVEALGIRPQHLELRKFIKFIRIIKNFNPDIIQTWLYHADFVGSLAGLIAGHRTIIWGLHHTLSKNSKIKISTAFIGKINSILSHWVPRKIVCCSESAFKAHASIGFEKRKLILIPNGINLSKFKPDPGASHSVRDELGVSQNDHLIGMMARFHPAKDHQLFISSAKLLLDTLPNVHFVMAGKDISLENPVLLDWIIATGKREHFHLLGERADMPRLFSGMDIVTLCSKEEALPLSLIEAMACGALCIATDVGDCKFILGKGGLCVNPDDEEELFQGWIKLLSLSPDELNNLKESARIWVAEQFDIINVAQKYLDIYKQTIGI